MQGDLSEAFGSMYLRSSPGSGDKAGEHRHRRPSDSPPLQTSETLESISTSAEDMLNDLVQPGFFSQATVPDDDRKGSNASIRTPNKVRIKSGPQRLMPGTLMAPSWESSLGEFADIVQSSEDQKPLNAKNLSVPRGASSGDPTPQPQTQSFQSHQQSSASPASTSPRPLERSQTQEQRQLLLSSLSQASPASVYIHKKEEINEVQASATAAKLHIRVISNDDPNEEDAMFVIGSDLQAVERMADELARSIKGSTQTASTSLDLPDHRSTAPGQSTLKAVAGGALVGVVGAWAGLAFS